MLFDRWAPTARALAATVLAACAPGGSIDAGRDAARPDVQTDHMLVSNDAADAAAPADVAPTVDVIAFDATPGGDAAYEDTPSSVDHSVGGDATVAMCMALADAYALAVHGAEVCSSRTDCSALVCETLCCNCRVYVNPSSTDDAEIARLGSAWAAAGCATATACVPMPCDPPASAECSSGGRCTTLRAGSGGAG